MGGFPAQKVAYASGVESAFIDGEVLAAAGQNGMAWPGHPAVTQIQRQMADAVNMAMRGALSPQEARISATRTRFATLSPLPRTRPPHGKPNSCWAS